jgi:Uma2 family endonuclease
VEDMLVRIRHPEKLIYPESDGQPMGENTVQVKWIIELYNGLQAAFRDRDDVFIAADLFWYPIYGDPTNVLAPDLMVVVGRPKGDRPSYKQWEEENIPPQVVFEILSPGNTERDRAKKLRFYRRYGVEEFYEYDPTSITS